MTEKLTETGICYGIEMDVDKAKVMRFSRQTFTVLIMIDQTQLQNVEYLNYFGRMMPMMQDVHVKLNSGFPWRSSIQQEEEEDSFHQQTA